VLVRIIERRASPNKRIRYEDYVRDILVKPDAVRFRRTK
jgi:hypothetical protein